MHSPRPHYYWGWGWGWGLDYVLPFLDLLPFLHFFQAFLHFLHRFQAASTFLAQILLLLLILFAYSTPTLYALHSFPTFEPSNLQSFPHVRPPHPNLLEMSETAHHPEMRVALSGWECLESLQGSNGLQGSQSWQSWEKMESSKG